MLIVGFNPGHDGALAVIKDRRLLLSLESEKDSLPRHFPLTPMSLLSMGEHIDEIPDLIAVGGWHRYINLQMLAPDTPYTRIGAGYHGSQPGFEQSITFFGRRIKLFSSSHVRSHILMAPGMAPKEESPLRAVLVWEGSEGTFYLMDDSWAIVRELPILRLPGTRYAFLYSIADPTFPDDQSLPRPSDSGKLMALAAYADPTDADESATEIVDLLLSLELQGHSPLKARLRDSPLYNVGVEADVTKAAAALLTKRLFDAFARVAVKELPRDIPLYISGGCGLNCDWNTMWRELGHFSSVFVPPCPNDSGSALGTAIDALWAVTGEPYIDWDVDCGLEFESDCEPDADKWKDQRLDLASLAEALASGRVIAWVQGRWEMGPRALGNRSLLAEPFNPSTRDRLNEIKQREGYRPIAPCCRLEDAGKVFDVDFEDPYMLYFRMVTDPRLGAVTHVDGSARAQTVTPQTNRRLHDLLSAFAEREGVGVLCNTSLNYKGQGFINRMSDLAFYCQSRGIDDFVVGDRWFQRIKGHASADRPESAPTGAASPGPVV